jgi:hypothetical protein
VHPNQSVLGGFVALNLESDLKSWRLILVSGRGENLNGVLISRGRLRTRLLLACGNYMQRRKCAIGLASKVAADADPGPFSIRFDSAFRRHRAIANGSQVMQQSEWYSVLCTVATIEITIAC